MEPAGTAGSLDIKHGNAGTHRAEKKAKQNRQEQREGNQRVEKPWAKVARTQAARPQGKREARKDGAPTGSRETAATVASTATAPDGAQKVRVEEAAK